MKTTISIITMALVGGGCFYFLTNGSDTDATGGVPAGMLFAAKRGTLNVTITENGSLHAKNAEKITFEANRSGVITYLIEEGKAVEEGEVLCKLETTELEGELQELELNILQTEADLDTARTELDIQQSENVANVEKAGIALTKSTNELECYRDGTAPKERRTLEVAIKEAQTNFSRAEKKYEDSVKLLEQDYVNKAQVDQDRIEFERADIQLVGARRDLEIFDQYTYPMAMTDKETAVADATRDLANAEKRAKSTLRQKEVAVESQDSRLTQLRKKRDEVKEMIAKFTLTAPSPGIVLYGDPEQWWYRENVKLGGQVWTGFTLFTIPDLRVMKVQLEIHEADINKIREEQHASVTMDTYPGMVLEGKVTKIATVAGGSGRRRDEEVKKFAVDITLGSTGGLALKPGISAKAEIFVEKREDVLFVPLQSVFFEEGKQYCFVKRDGPEPVRVEVKSDLSNDSYVQIAEGLDVGERVLLYNPVLHAATESLAAGQSPPTESVELASTAEPAKPE